MSNLSLDLPLIFAELQKPGSWANVEFNFPETRQKGMCQIESNGPFLHFKPKSKIPPFFLFIGNYTPMMNPAKPSVMLQHMQRPTMQQVLTFADTATRDQFTAAFFESLARLETYFVNASMLDYCRSDKFTAILPGHSRPSEIMCVLQSNGKNSVVQGHIIEKGKVAPGFSHSVAKTSIVAPILTIPDGLKKVVNVSERAFCVGDAASRHGPDVVVVCGNAQEMMTWVLSVYLAIVVCGRKVTRKSTAEVQEEKEEAVEIDTEDVDVRKKTYDMKFPEAGDVSVRELLTKYGVEEPTRVRCPFADDVKNGDARRQAVLLGFLFANGIRDKDSFKKAVEKTPAADVANRLGDGFVKQVSLFVSACLREARMKAVLKAIASDEKWMSEFYEVGALIRFPGLCSQVADIVREGECEESESLLENVSFDDECRYLRSSSFKFLNIVNSASKHLVKGILEQLEDGMIYPGLKMTNGPWTLIGECVSSGAVSDSLAEAYNWINNSSISDERRVCASKIEELIFEGIDKDLICDWLKELNQKEDHLVKYYKTDATLCDGTRVAFVVNYLQNQMEQFNAN